MQIAILLYHRFTALHAVGPYEVLSLLPGAEVLFVAEQPGPVADYWGSLQLVAGAALGDMPSPDILSRSGVAATSERVVFDGKYVTAAGVSAGIDMGLALAGRIAGDEIAQAIQLGIEYDPQPPYDAGSPDRAPADIVSAMRARSRFILTGRPT